MKIVDWRLRIYRTNLIFLPVFATRIPFQLEVTFLKNESQNECTLGKRVLPPKKS